MIKDDNVLLFVQRLVKNNCIGETFPLSKLLNIFEEGEKRYFYKIPPDYMDIKKDEKDITKRKKFGDLILWKQILEKAHKCNCPLIFVTLDEKEDWWVLDKDGQPERPREELFKEFKEYSSEELIILNLSNFIDHASVINNMVDHTTHIELNAEEVSLEIIELKGWEETLDDYLNLTSYLIHSGDLESHLENALSDVEIYSIELPNLSIDSTEIVDENHVVIEGAFTCEIEATVTESFSRYYSEDCDVSMEISGSISLEFEVDFEKEKDFIKIDSAVITVGGFEVVNFLGYKQEYAEEDRCSRCKKPNAHLLTSEGEAICQECSVHFEICPNCAKLFETGTLGGAFCSHCSEVS
ncbi:PIN-like domain-containing protein [Paenibacillus monticola]|uniref:PIN like domain-containing protein n=1 Tax=Paenibacillus monticola TaxID=2666075 RepID=A0A7X2L4A8_9BACL|nr:PIN-like domain-containing protein [Paenibacillus monticola]MRN56842.1 hypothetical protein [Paenibacillus monticola]